MVTGMAMMLKSFGVDPEKIVQDFTNLKDGVTKTLQYIEQRLDAIEKTQSKVIEQNNELLTLMREVTAWKRQQQHLLVLNQPSQPPTVQPPPNL